MYFIAKSKAPLAQKKIDSALYKYRVPLYLSLDFPSQEPRLFRKGVSYRPCTGKSKDKYSNLYPP